MRRALSAAIALSITYGLPAQGGPSQPSAEVDAALRYGAREWNVSYLDMRQVSRCESRWNPRSTNGSHDGLFQHKRRSWQGRVAAFNRHVRLHNEREPNKLETMAGDRWAPIDQARLTGAYVAGVLPGYRGGWSWWSQCR